MILLDTYALIWLPEERPELGERTRHLADDAQARDVLGVSAVTLATSSPAHSSRRNGLLVQGEEARGTHHVGEPL
jgi:hypothetical protein